MEGRVGVVTGGATGLGLQMATALAEAGANVVICSRKLENCEEAAHGIEKLGVKALAYGCDVTKPEQVEALKEAAMKKFGRVDALINNAGRAWVAPVEDLRDSAQYHRARVVERLLVTEFTEKRQYRIVLHGIDMFLLLLCVLCVLCALCGKRI